MTTTLRLMLYMAILKKLFNSGAKDLMNSVSMLLIRFILLLRRKNLYESKIKEIFEPMSKTFKKKLQSVGRLTCKAIGYLSQLEPLSLAFLLFVLSVFTLIDFSFIDLEIKTSWIDLWQLLAITAFGAYFGGRSYEKIKK